MVKEKIMTVKTFTIAGVSTQHNITKYRFANGTVEGRQNVLTRAEHHDIKLYALPTPMTKDAARTWLEQKFAADGVKITLGRKPKEIKAAA